jgi:hypothetical protein
LHSGDGGRQRALAWVETGGTHQLA